MGISLSVDVRNAYLQLIADAIDAAATPGKFLLYSGTRPAAGGTPTGLLQATILFAQPCGTVADALLTFVPGEEGVRMDDEPITWGRMADGDDNYVLDGDVTNMAGSGDFKIGSTTGIIGAVVRLDEGVIGV